MDGRWKTPFGRWVKRYGVTKLAERLQVTRSAVLAWVSGRAVPRPEKALIITKLSRGKLSVAQVYAHHEQVDRQLQSANLDIEVASAPTLAEATV